MFRRIIAVFLIFSHLSVLTTSCIGESDDGPAPTEPDAKDALGVVDDPGQFHNDILEEFNHDNVLTSGKRLDRDAFAERFLDAANSVLAKRGLATTVDRADVELILNRFEEYQSFGFFDFDSQDTGRLRAIDYSMQRGDIDEIEAERLNGVFREFEQIRFSPSTQERVHRLFVRHMRRGLNENRIVSDALDVGDHSYQFWTDLLGEAPARVKAGDGPERINTWWIRYAAVDMIATLFLGGMGPVGVIAAAAISAAFYMAAHAGD